MSKFVHFGFLKFQSQNSQFSGLKKIKIGKFRIFKSVSDVKIGSFQVFQGENLSIFVF